MVKKCNVEYSIGNDLEELSRFKIEKIEMYCNKILSVEEREFITNFSDSKKIRFIASRFCMKEAILKAIGIGISCIKFSDITIVNNKLGKPVVNLHGFDVDVSVSYTKELVSAVALVRRGTIE